MKISVAMITYNHERFIAQAIESVLMQETDFDYEIIIGEDCSTDRTRETVMDFQRKFPDKIRLLLPESNLGMHENLAQTFRACKGQYIALLEGDDYWTSPNKLQKQADFLDMHSECSICFHPVTWFYEDDYALPSTGPKDKSSWPETPKTFSTIEDLLQSMFIQTGSVMLRNGLLSDYPGWIYSLRMADWPLYLLYAHQGKIGCLKEVMSTHRKHSGGVCYNVGDETIYKEVIKMYDYINTHLKSKYKSIIQPLIAAHYLKLAILYDQKNCPELARNYITKSIVTSLLSRRALSLNTFKMFFRLNFPSLYHFSKKLIRA